MATSSSIAWRASPLRRLASLVLSTAMLTGGTVAVAQERGKRPSLEELIQSANDHFTAAEAAQRTGDWTRYGTELEALQQDLQRLLEATQAAP